MTLLKTALPMLVLLATITSVAQETFTSPDGFYRFNLPAGWQRQSSENGVLLTRDEVRMTLLQLPAAPAEEVIERALAELGISPGSLISSNDAPLPNGAWKQQIFAELAHLQIALAQARDAKALAIVIEGGQSAIQAVNPQIVQFLTSINFGDMRQPDCE